MLGLDSPRWRELQHAYGSAAGLVRRRSAVIRALSIAPKGFPAVAEAVQELTPLVAAEFLEWFRAR
jgi:hypothetical protein